MKWEIVECFQHAGLDCLVAHITVPFLGSYYTGYVALPEGHPFFGKDYGWVMDRVNLPEELTFAGTHEAEGTGTWFIGFDFAHIGMYSYVGHRGRPKSDAVKSVKQIAEIVAKITS